MQPEAVCLQKQTQSVFLLNTRFGCTYYSQAITHTLDITFSRIQINQYIPIQSGHIFHEPAPIHFIHYVGSNTFRVLMYKFTFVVYIPRGVIILTFRCCQRSNTYKCLAFSLFFFWGWVLQMWPISTRLKYVCDSQKKGSEWIECEWVFIRL